jgi:glutaminase
VEQAHTAGSDQARRAPIASPIQRYLEELHSTCAQLTDGRVATYIPELAKADPGWFGICLATTDGRVYEVGDSRQPFTIQSISKPYTYGLALEDIGRDAVLRKIGVEPTGDAFNSISLAQDTGCPLNPMINAGAIAAVSLIAGTTMEDKLHRLLAVYSLYAGRSLEIDRSVYESERDSGHRNRAIGHMLRNFGILTADPEPVLDLYFRQCSILVTCRDLSLMAATLANGGVNPLTGERAVRHDLVEDILTVMATCGMYDYAGQWVYWVGMPAKSGVGGGVLAVLPGQLGIGVFSPPLDARGNSVRGVAVCKQLSRDFNLHFLRVPRAARSTIRAQYTLAGVSSKRLRNESERLHLDAAGQRAKIYDLQGDLGFAATEALIRRIVDAGADTDFVVLELRRVTRIEDCVAGMLLPLVLDLAAAGKQLALASAHEHPRFVRALEEGLAAAEQDGGRLPVFADLDAALEWCENRLLGSERAEEAGGAALPLAQHPICRNLTAGQLAHLERLIQRRRFRAGELILRTGDPADALYFLMSGRVSVTVALPSGQMKRLSTLSPGMPFGELAIVDRSERTADVHADTAVDCCALSAADFDRLGTTHPEIKVRILENLLRNASRTVARLNHEIATLAR